jgi:hypothetical protein
MFAASAQISIWEVDVRGLQRFRGDDGAVPEGPATTPIPRFEARLAGSGVEVRSIPARS